MSKPTPPQPVVALILVFFSENNQDGKTILCMAQTMLQYLSKGTYYMNRIHVQNNIDLYEYLLMLNSKLAL